MCSKVCQLPYEDREAKTGNEIFLVAIVQDVISFLDKEGVLFSYVISYKLRL